jgi:hypothetical protein
MQRTPYQTYLAERLQSARGLGWVMPENPPLSKGCGRDFCAGGQGDALSNLPQPPFGKGGGEEKGAPAWFRFTYLALRSLGLAR